VRCRGRERGSRRSSLLSLSGNRDVGSTRSVPTSLIRFSPRANYAAAEPAMCASNASAVCSGVTA